MIWLIVVAALLVVAVVWFVARPLRGGGRASGETELRHELQQVRDRLLVQLNELDAESADKAMDTRTAKDEELRLSAELAEVLKGLDALPEAGHRVPATVRDRRLWAGTLATLAIALVAVGGGLYGANNWGMLSGLVRMATSGGQVADGAQVPPMVFEMVAKLEKRLRAEPNDPEGWARLGRAYYVLKRKPDAFGAYAKAFDLAPDNVGILADYAWVVFNEQPGVTTGLAYTLYSRLYQLDPVNPDALWFMGLAAYQKGEPRQAIGFWQRLTRVLPSDNPAQAELRKVIARVEGEIKR